MTLGSIWLMTMKIQGQVKSVGTGRQAIASGLIDACSPMSAIRISLELATEGAARLVATVETVPG